MTAIVRVVYITAALLLPSVVAELEQLGYSVEAQETRHVVGYLWPEGFEYSGLSEKPMHVAPGGTFKVELSPPGGEKKKYGKILNYGDLSYRLMRRLPDTCRGFSSALPVIYLVGKFPIQKKVSQVVFCKVAAQSAVAA